MQSSLENAFSRNNFDALRIIAATEVLLLHSFVALDVPVPAWFSPLGLFPGVPMFFAISGFLVSSSLERSPSLLAYFKNRALRIFPGLWTCLLITTIIAAFFGFNLLRVDAVVWFFSQMIGAIYTPRFLADFGRGSYNGSLWTIPVELQFYVALPIIYAVARFLPKKAAAFSIIFAASIVLALAIRLYFPTFGAEGETSFEKLIRYSLLPHLFLFLTGVVLQVCVSFRQKYLAGKAHYWIAVYVGCKLLLPESPVQSVIVSLLLAFCVISFAYSWTDLSKFLHGRADLSYGVYIYHGLFLNVLIQLGMKQQMLHVMIILLLSYGVAYLSWTFVEAPCLRRKRTPPAQARPTAAQIPSS